MPRSTKQSSSKQSPKSEQPERTGIGIPELAKRLDIEPRLLRKHLRNELDMRVGRGSKYSWPSFNTPAVKRIIKSVEAAD